MSLRKSIKRVGARARAATKRYGPEALAVGGGALGFLLGGPAGAAIGAAPGLALRQKIQARRAAAIGRSQNYASQYQPRLLRREQARSAGAGVVNYAEEYEG